MTMVAICNGKTFFISIAIYVNTNVVLFFEFNKNLYVYRVLDSRHVLVLFIFLIFLNSLRIFLCCTGCNDTRIDHRKHFLSLFWILIHPFFALNFWVMVKNWMLSWDSVSRALKHETKHSDKTFPKTLSKKLCRKMWNQQLKTICYKTVCYKNSEASLKKVTKL